MKKLTIVDKYGKCRRKQRVDKKAKTTSKIIT